MKIAILRQERQGEEGAARLHEQSQEGESCCQRWLTGPADSASTDLQRGSLAPLAHHLRPSSTSVPLEGSARIDEVMLVASELATAGSVMQKQLRTVPRSRGSSQARCWAREP